MRAINSFGDLARRAVTHLGRFFETQLALYGGMALLFAASVHNDWRRRVASYGEAKG
jgi:hypothetical protein